MSKDRAAVRRERYATDPEYAARERARKRAGKASAASRPQVNAQLTLAANKRRLRTEGAILLASIMDEALAEMTRQFNDSLAQGELVELVATRDDIRRWLTNAVARELT